MSRLLSVICIFVLILFVACEEEESPEVLNPNDLIGSWDLVSSSATFGANPSTQQQAVLMFAPGIGGIQVSGDFDQTLDYFFMLNFGFSQIAMISNHVIFEENYLPSYMLSIAFAEGTTALDLAITLEDSTTYTFSSENVVAAFDQSTLSFQMDAITLTSDDGSKQVSLSGSVAVRQVLLPAGEYTEFEYFDDVDFGPLLSYTFEFRDDQTLLMMDDGMGEVDTALATWEIQDNDLTISTLDEEGGLVTGVAGVSFVGDELWLESTLICSDQAVPAECLMEGESLLGLESGSLTEFREIQTMKFTRSGLSRRVPPTSLMDEVSWLEKIKPHLNEAVKSLIYPGH